MRLQYKETNSHRTESFTQQLMISGKELLESNKIPQRFTHFLSVDSDHIVMHPVLHRIFSKGCARLGNFTLMVGKHQVHSTSMNIEFFTEIFRSHGRTFHMPSGEAFAPRSVPAHNVFRRSLFPQCKIYAATFLALSIEVTCSLKHIINISS
ncbi:hypothetical protein SDC9_111290 [bioreactor metagenome]|uniref:Uncharacterized protein n=1 Tax=bioreactor metagenome TaxID=1076179 RepID=A0A645BRG6_9ZZZZ